VRDTCGYNPWVNAGLFTTRCSAIAAPFYEPFNNRHTPPCWLNYNVVGLPKDSVHVSSSNFAPLPQLLSTTWQLADYTGTNGFFAFANWFRVNSVTRHALELPDIDVSNLNQPAISFFAFHKHWAPDSSNIGLTVEWDSLGNWMPFKHWQNYSGNWQYRYAALPAHAPDTVRLRLVWWHVQKTGTNLMNSTNASNINDFIVVDDIRVENLSNCLPLNIVNVNVTSPTQASITTSGGSGTYELAIGGLNFAHGTGLISQHNGSSANLSNLQPGTIYHVYARNICNGLPSQWSEPTIFKTPCDGSIQTLPYEQGFEALELNDTTFNFVCWQNQYTTGYKWRSWNFATPSTLFGTGPFGDNSMNGRGKYIYTDGDFGILGDSTFVVSPQINLGQALNPYLTMYYSMRGLSIGSMCVQVESNGIWQNLGNCVVGQQPIVWNKLEQSLMAYNGQTIRIRIKATRGNFITADLAIDNFRVIDSCVFGLPIAGFTDSFDSLNSNGFFVRFTSLASNASQVTWYFGDGASDTGNIVTHAYQQNGLYTVWQVVQNPCGDIDSISKVVQITGIGITEFAYSEALLYPNPSNSVIYLQTQNLSPIDVVLYSNTGQAVLRAIAVQPGEAIDVGHLPIGMYVVQIEQNKQVYFRKFLKN
jgi:hypothetical protein